MVQIVEGRTSGRPEWYDRNATNASVSGQNVPGAGGLGATAIATYICPANKRARIQTCSLLFLNNNTALAGPDYIRFDYTPSGGAAIPMQTNWVQTGEAVYVRVSVLAHDFDIKAGDRVDIIAFATATGGAAVDLSGSMKITEYDA